MSPLAAIKLTPEEYLQQERAADFKSEFYDGETFALAGVTRWHSLIMTNLVAFLGHKLRGSSCRVFNTDLRLHLDETGLFDYPDLMVACGELRFLDEHQDTLLNPTLIVEVLSPSTSDYDRGGKAAHYRTIPSLVEYLVVEQDRAHAELWRRQNETTWTFTDIHGLESEIQLDSVGLRLPMAEIFDGIDPVSDQS